MKSYKKKASSADATNKYGVKCFSCLGDDGKTVYIDQFGGQGCGLFRVRLKRVEYSLGSVVVAADSATTAGVIAPRVIAHRGGEGFNLLEGYERSDVTYYTDYLHRVGQGPSVELLAGIDHEEMERLNDISQRLNRLGVNVGELRKILRSCEGIPDTASVPPEATVEATAETKTNDESKTSGEKK